MIGCCFGVPFGVMTLCNILIIASVRRSRMRIKASDQNTLTLKDLSRTCSDGDKRTLSYFNCSFCMKSNRPSHILNDSFLFEKTATIETTESSMAGGDKKPNINCIDDSNKIQQKDFVYEDSQGFGSKVKLKTCENCVNAQLPTESLNEDDPNKATNRTSLENRTRLHNPCKSDLQKDAKCSVSTENRSAIRRREEIRLALSLIVVVVIFVICWLPYCCSILLQVFYNGFIPREFHVFTLVLGYMNSGCNPIVYGVMNKRFKQGFKELLCFWKKC